MPEAVAGPGPGAPLQTLLRLLAIVVWLGGIHINTIVCVTALWHLPDLWAVTVLAFWAALCVLPIQEDSKLGQAVAKFICTHAPPHFPMEVRFEAKGALDPDGLYVFGWEPHSVLPLGLLGVTQPMGTLPLLRTKALASSVVFKVPIIRHVWSWLGLAPATRDNFKRLLAQQSSIVIVPGGVQECLYMRHGEEVLFLSKRTGFVRLAMQAGAALVPTFCFGQTQCYDWWKPRWGLYDRMSRLIGFAPILFWGVHGSFVPYRTPMVMVVGKPIPLEKCEEPSLEQVLANHSKFVTAMEELFERHKVSAGHPELRLRIL